MTTDNRTLFFMGIFCLLGNTAAAQKLASKDSLHLEHMQEVVVSGVRTQDNAPFAVTTIKREKLQEHSKTDANCRSCWHRHQASWLGARTA